MAAAFDRKRIQESREGEEYFDHDCWTERCASFDSRKNFETCFIFLFFYFSKRLNGEEWVENSEWKVFRNKFLQRISSQEREKNISITIAELRCALFDSIRERILNLFHLFIFLFFGKTRWRKRKDSKIRNEKFFGTNFYKEFQVFFFLINSFRTESSNTSMRLQSQSL